MVRIVNLETYETKVIAEIKYDNKNYQKDSLYAYIVEGKLKILTLSFDIATGQRELYDITS